MHTLGTILIAVGALVYLFGWWPVIREIFGENRMMGYAAFSFPIITFVWALMRMDEFRREFWFQLAGIVLAGAGIGLQHAAAA